MSCPFILVDGSSFLFRAYHALPDLSTSSGQVTGAIYGVTNMLRKLVRECDPEHIAVVFDAKGKTFRHEMYTQYKANRPPAPPELVSQIQYVHDIVRAMGLPLICEHGVEADDVIGTLAVAATEAGMETLIVTGDKDMAQLVNESVTLVDTMKDVTTDTTGVMKKFAVRPDQIIDYLALVGDTSDNIPGVPKVGPKTAAKWLAEYDNIDRLIENASEVAGKVGENLRDNVDQLRLSRTLTRIKLDVPLAETPQTLQRTQADFARLRSLYEELDFRSWLRDLESGDGQGADLAAASEKPVATYEAIMDESALTKWIEAIKDAGFVAVDTETTSLDAQQARLVGLSFCVRAGQAAYLPLGHSYAGVPQQLPFEQTLEQLKPLLEDEEIKKVGQNIKYDYIVLKRHGIKLAGIANDTMLASYVAEAGLSRHDMDTLARRHLDHETIEFKSIAGTGKKQLTFDQIALEQAVPYAAEDAEVTFRLHHALQPMVGKEAALKTLLETIELPLLEVLARTEMQGVCLDAQKLAQQSHELGEQLKALEQQCHSVAGGPFNIASPKQIGHILFEQLGLPVIKKTAGGQPSTAEGVLQEMADQGHELPALILQYRGLAKLKSTYTDKLPQLINPHTRRVHTSFHQAVASTGRLSSSDPNLQNIPIRTAEGRRVREAFIAEEGYTLLAADYSQIELRLMAHLSEDKRLIQAFKDGEDIHAATASEVFGVPREQVDRDLRSRAKAINFGLIYGMSAFGLARNLHIERDVAAEYISLYFSRYPGVKAFMEAQKERAKKQGYVETLHGRRLYLPEIRSRNYNLRQGAERVAINAPLQGSAADLIKLAMIDVDTWIRQENPQTRLILQVHDELVLEVPDAELETVRETVSQLMSGVAELSIPLVVDTGIGQNWKDAH